MLPEILRDGGWKVTVTVLDNKQIIDLEKGDTSDLYYGLAVDIGTTKIAAYLTDLGTSETVAVSTMVNPQIIYGEDVLSRITYAVQHKKGIGKLQKKWSRL